MNKTLLLLPVFLLLITAATAQNSPRVRYNESGIKKTYPTHSQTTNRDTQCDTLRYPLDGNIIYYILQDPGKGYITGNNNYGDLAKAEYFQGVEAGSSISGILADFAVAINASNPQITFAVWDNTGTGGKPGNMLASATRSLSSIVDDVTEYRITSVSFAQPLTLTGPCYVGVVLPQTPGDTVALWCREHEESYAGTAWEQWSDQDWYAMNDPLSWGPDLQTSMTIYPVICKTVGIDEVSDPEAAIHPNPATGVVNINIWKGSSSVKLELFTLTGKLVLAKKYPGAVTNFNVDLSSLPKGVFMLRLSDGSHLHNQKIVLR